MPEAKSVNTEKISVTIEAIRLAHNRVVMAKENLDQQKLTEAILELGDLLGQASPEIQRLYSAETK